MFIHTIWNIFVIILYFEWASNEIILIIWYVAYSNETLGNLIWNNNCNMWFI